MYISVLTVSYLNLNKKLSIDGFSFPVLCKDCLICLLYCRGSGFPVSIRNVDQTQSQDFLKPDNVLKDKASKQYTEGPGQVLKCFHPIYLQKVLISKSPGRLCKHC